MTRFPRDITVGENSRIIVCGREFSSTGSEKEISNNGTYVGKIFKQIGQEYESGFNCPIAFSQIFVRIRDDVLEFSRRSGERISEWQLVAEGIPPEFLPYLITFSLALETNRSDPQLSVIFTRITLSQVNFAFRRCIISYVMVGNGFFVDLCLDHGCL
jgi:uncharacterized membrane protein